MKPRNIEQSQPGDQNLSDGTVRIGRRAFLARSTQALAGMATAAVFTHSVSAVNPALAAATLGTSHAENLAMICERIIPTTDTPGAIAAGVPEYIAEVLNQVYLEEESDRFISNLREFGEHVGSSTGREFSSLTPSEQDEQLQRLAESDDERESDFFNELRRLTVFGYYTSELGAKSETALANPMAPWNGDIAFSDVGKVWTR